MANKTVLICGITGGIGREVAKQMLAEKMDVCGIYCDENKAADLEEKLGARNLFLYQIDLAGINSTNEGLKKILAEHAKIGVVVFSVSAPIEYKQILMTLWEDYSRHWDLQLKGIYNVVQGLKEQIVGGHGVKFIILLTEACWGKPPSGLAPYISAKYALLGLAKSMAVELAKYNCTVNFVSPGMVQTDLIAGFPAKLVELQAASNPLKRIAKPEDVANAVLFLVRDESSYLNGVNIAVNGGQVML